MKKYTIIEKLLCLILAGLIISIPLYPYIKAWALEFHADKNAAFNFTAPLINSTNTSLFAVGANNTYVYINSNDGTTFAAAATNITRVDAGGIYLFQLNATEMNHDLIGVYYNGTGCLQQYFAINTKLKEIADSVYTALANGTVVSASVTGNVGGNVTGQVLGNVTGTNMTAMRTVVDLINSNTTLIPGIQTSLSNGTVVTTDTAKITAINATVNHATYGNEAIKTQLGLVANNATATNATVNHATYGNSAIKTLLDRVNANATAINQTVNHATYGNSALLTAVNTRGTSNLTASDNIGINWADVSNPTTAVNLSGTNIKTDQVVASVSGAVGSVTGNVSAVTGNVGGNVLGSVASVTGNVSGINASAIKTQTDKITFDASNRTIANATAVGDKTGYALSSAGVQAIWDALTSALSTASSIGKLIVDNLNAAITSRMATFTLPGNFSAMNITADGNVTTATAGGATAQQVWEYSNRTITNVTAGVVAAFFTTNSTKTYADAIDGSVVKEIATNSGGASAPTAAQIRAEMDANSTKLGAISNATDGDKEGTSYTGIEEMIRIHR